MVVVRDRVLGSRPGVLVGVWIPVLPGVARKRVVASVSGCAASGHVDTHRVVNNKGQGPTTTGAVAAHTNSARRASPVARFG